jgi:hypothetical protein
MNRSKANSMTGDQSVIKSTVAMGQKPFIQATCPQTSIIAK